jgi:hypothetical protein
MRAIPRLLVAVALLTVAPSGITSRSISPHEDAANPVTVTVTVIARSTAAPQLTASGVTVHVDGKMRPVTSLELASITRPVDLIVLIDNALARNRENRWDELQAFLRAQPVGVPETIAYADGKAITIAQASTTDHALAANAVANPAPKSAPRDVLYESVQNLIDSWPSGSRRRVLIFVTRGFPRDYANNGVKPENSLLLQRLIEDAQRNRVLIYTIHSSPALANDPNPLTLLATNTGGKGFVTGMEPGPSLQNFLQEIQNCIERQYSITFSVAPDAKPHFAALRVAINTKTAELRYPARIYVTAK